MKRDHTMTTASLLSREPVWHHELVGTRLIDAASVIRRMPMRIWPKGFGSAWPADISAMSASELQALKVDILKSGGEAALAAWERDQNRVRIPPSGTEIERADEALGWIMKYLGQDQSTAQSVSFWASRTYDIEQEEIPVFVRAGLREISRGLRRDRVAVRG